MIFYAFPFPLTVNVVLRLRNCGPGTRLNGSRAVRDGGGSDPTTTLTHGASKGGVAPASSEVWAASFLVAVFGIISFLFLRFAALQE